MSGEELSKAFKSLNPETEVIIFTTFENITAAKECFQSGVLYEYIYKPTSNMENFASTVKKGVRAQGGEGSGTGTG